MQFPGKPFSDDRIPEPKDQLYSLGALCQTLQCTPAQIIVLMDACEIRKFDRAIDGVPYLDGNSTELILAKRREILAEIESVRTSARNN